MDLGLILATYLVFLMQRPGRSVRKTKWGGKARVGKRPWGFVEGEGKATHYGIYTTSFLGFTQVIQPEGLMDSQTRFGLYRWHVRDPIRFQSDLSVTIQDLGWRKAKENRYLQRSDDIASIAFWY